MARSRHTLGKQPCCFLVAARLPGDVVTRTGIALLASYPNLTSSERSKPTFADLGAYAALGPAPRRMQPEHHHQAAFGSYEAFFLELL